MRRSHAWLTLVAVALLAGGLWLGRTARADSPSHDDTSKKATAKKATATVKAPSYGALEGRALFEYYCSTCHGNEGRGDGFNSYNLDPKPRDLSDPAFQAKRSDKDLAAVIRSGGGFAGLSNTMPPWGHTLSERQIGYIVEFLRTLKPEPEDDTD